MTLTDMGMQNLISNKEQVMRVDKMPDIVGIKIGGMMITDSGLTTIVGMSKEIIIRKVSAIHVYIFLKNAS